MRNSVVHRGCLLITAAAGVWGTPARGQVSVSQPVDRHGIFRVADSVEAFQTLDRITALENEGRYMQAGGEYRRVLTEHGASVVRIEDGTFVGVRPLVLDRLSRWPTEARNASRSLFETQAGVVLASVKESEPSQVMAEASRWWLTTSAGDAALRLAEELAAGGRPDTANRLVRQIQSGYPDWITRITETQRAIMNARPSAGIPHPPASLPSMAGPATLLWECRPGVQTTATPTTTSQEFTPTIGKPIVVGDRLLVRDANRLWCIRLYSGNVEWSIGPKEAIVDDPAIQAGSPAVGNELVFAILAGGECKLRNSGVSAKAPGHGFRTVRSGRGAGADLAGETPVPHLLEQLLTAADLTTGDIRWFMPASKLLGHIPGPESSFRSDPLWYEGDVYVVVGERTAGVDDFYLLQVDPTDGRKRWGRHLAGGLADTKSLSQNLETRPAGSRSHTGFGTGSKANMFRLGRGDGLIRVEVPGVLVVEVSVLAGDVQHARILKDLKTSSMTSRPTTWEHVVGAQDLALCVQGGRIRAELRGADAAAMFDRRIRERPADAGRHLDLARWAIRQRDGAKRAVAAMEQALACVALSSLPAATTSRPTVEATDPRAAGIRRQVLEIALAHAEQDAATDALCNLARQAAIVPEDQVQYRLRFGETRIKNGRSAEAVALWQEILEDDRLRECDLTPDHAGLAAEAAIAEAIGRSGRTIYEAIESRASAELNQSEGDGVRLESVARRYPNSRAAVQAWMMLATRHRQTGEPLQAVRQLQEAFRRSKDEVRREIVAGIAECHFEMGDAPGGLAWLARGTREFPEDTVTFAGRDARFADHEQSWRANANTISIRTPILDPPLEPSFERTYEQPVTLLSPPADDAAFQPRFDIALLQYGGELLAIDPRTGRERWGSRWADEHAPVWLTGDERTILLGTAWRVVALDRGSGAERWQYGVSSADIQDYELIDPEVVDAITAQAFSDSLAVLALKSGWLGAIRLSSGRRLWRERVPGDGISLVAADDEHVACIRSTNEPPSVLLLDAESGKKLHEFPADGLTHPHALMLLPDGNLAIADERQVVVFEPTTARPLWRWSPPEQASILGVRANLGTVHVFGRGFAAAVATADGRALWVKDVFGQPDEQTRFLWVAGGQIFAVGLRSVAVVDPATGERRWVEQLGPEETIESATLTPRWLVAMVSKTTPGGPTGPRRVEAVFLSRSMGGTGERSASQRYPLTEAADLRKTAVFDGAVLLQAGGRIAGWVAGPAGSNPAGRVDSPEAAR
ncbi:MAG TPA: PQQ-binding-like beta-propeller repeat protein [Phycisphaerae bacterium]|nr:PQQ-binding-like beta-propeller repeat protein [Phycisphaerae bacterium]